MMRELHAIQLPPGRALYAAVAAALRGGPAVLPLDVRLPTARLAAVLAALRPHALITASGARTDLRDPVPCPDGIAAVVATSGTTGAPKGVELSAAALTASARATLSVLAARPGDRWLACLPTAHIGGLQVYVRSVLAGRAPLTMDTFEPARFRAATFDYTALVPTMLVRLLATPQPLPAHRGMLVGGAGLAMSLHEQANAAGARVVSTYGLTETAGGCVYEGTPLPGTTVRIEPDRRILLRGPTLASGYRLHPGTLPVTPEGWLRTEDAGEWTLDGRLTVLGRLDDAITCAGRTIFPGQVETVLADHPGIRAVAVAGRDDPEWGQRIVAFVVPADPADPPGQADLRGFVADRGEGWLAPHEVVTVARLPLLGSGKVDRRALVDGLAL